MEIRVLGPLGAIDAGRQVALGGRRQRSVLAGLAVHAGEGVSTARLIEIVWGEDPPPTARKSLQTYVSRLRRSLGDGLIAGVADGYVLRVGAEQLDALRFVHLASEGRRCVESDPAAAWDLLSEALGLWRGAPLADIEPNGDVHAYVERLQEARLGATEDRIEAGLALGQHRQLIGDLSTLVDEHPLRERLCGQLMLALYRSGRPAEALEVFGRWRRTLADELGLEPSAALRQLETRMLRQDPALELAPSTDHAAAAGPERNPYKGLRAFGEADAHDFFGREALVERLVATVEAGARVVALVGPSGSGKSSLALAGLAPALRRTADGRVRLVARMSPGTHPFAQLAAALARAAPEGTALPDLPEGDALGLLRAVLTVVPDERTEVLLVIDQFEELLTGTIAERTVVAFVRNLVEALEDPHGQLLVALTLRSDFLDEALRLPDLAELLGSGTVHVPPMTAVELQAAVIRPAAAVGLSVEPELAAELVTETASNPAALPLLQFVLTELTDHVEGSTLTLAALRRAGGIRGTLAQRAEHVFDGLSPAGQQAARRLLLRLVALNEVGEPTRRVVPVDELTLTGVEDRLRGEVLDAFVAGRLLSYGREPLSGRATVEVTHEAVLRSWPRCQRWVEAATTDIRISLDLERAAADWLAAERDPDYLLTGSRLRFVEDWDQASELGTTRAARSFLAASVARRREEEDAEAERRERERILERRAVHRLRISVAVLALLVGVTTVLTALAVSNSNEASRQEDAALAAASEILVRQLSYAAVAESGRDPELGLLLGLHAVRVAVALEAPLARETLEALHWGLQELRVPYPLADGDPFVLMGVGGPRGAYNLPPQELVALAQRSLTRDLAEEECRTFLTGEGCPTLPPDLARSVPADDVRIGPDPLGGTRVRVIGSHAGAAALEFRSEFAGFTESTGIEVIYTEASTIEEDMASGDAQRNHDIVVIPQPGVVPTESAAGRLVDLGTYLARDRIVDDYGDHLASLVTVAQDGDWPADRGHLAAVPLNANLKGRIWYVPERFERAGYEIPTTWDELLALSDRIVADGGTPWCFAEESEAATGWPATDWVEVLVLQHAGPEVYDGWVAGEIPFGDPRVRQAFERLGDLVFTEGYVRGGINTALTTPFWAGTAPLLENPPGCWLYQGPTFVTFGLPPGTELGVDISTFPAPPESSGVPPVELIGGDLAMVYTDRPEVRALVEHLASPRFGRYLGESGWFLASNRRFEPHHYPDRWRRELAEDLARAQDRDAVRFDGSDLMPPWIGTSPFWNAMVAYFQGGPDSLDEILARLDALEPPADEAGDR